jgi:hypothetical protein
MDAQINPKDEECDGGMVQTANPSEESSVKRGVGQVVGGLVITKLNESVYSM